MNSPSPFAAIQAIQEEQREGWMTENKTATAMNIETLAGICFNTSRGLAPFECVEWKDVNDQLRAANIAGMQSALDAYLTSIGEGMPSVEDCRSVAKDGCEAIRNLLLSAFAKKMEAIAKLPEKWRKENVMGCGFYASELEAALGSLPVEPAPEVTADPYAHLKLAWANKRRIRTRRKGSDGWSEWNQPGDVVFYWNLPPECYEIEPLPADKWAKEKAAHAQGKKIEMLISDDEYGPERWSFCELPDWHDRCEYRIAPDPDPAPAGKLTDEQLGEIGATAAAHWFNENGQEDQQLMYVSETGPYAHSDTPARTAFAAAVREAVEAKQAEEIARITAKSEEMCQSFVAEAAKKHEALAIIEQAIEMVNTPGTTKDNLPKAINAKIMQRDEVHDATLKKLDAANTELKRLQSASRMCTADMDALKDQLAKANAELERLRWRSMEVPPTQEDAAPCGLLHVITNDGTVHSIAIAAWSMMIGELKWWRPFCPPPALTAEEKERAEFEKSYRKAYPDADADIFSRQEDGHYFNLFVNGMWKLWKDFSASQEVKA